MFILEIINDYIQNASIRQEHNLNKFLVRLGVN